MTASEPAVPFKRLISSRGFPCLGARAAARRGSLEVRSYGDVLYEARLVASDLSAFVHNYEQPASTFAAFAVIDEGARCTNEIEFEDHLWRVLRNLRSYDREPWDRCYSRNPDDSSFKYSFAGRAMFVIGLHPNSSRRARRSSEHVIVFNPVWQFENLRNVRHLDALASAIRARDIRWDGSINPNLHYEGSHTDALQYAGREVDGSWKCPYSSW
jgi:FPC/CPF motif-containing protein YcgG